MFWARLFLVLLIVSNGVGRLNATADPIEQQCSSTSDTPTTLMLAPDAADMTNGTAPANETAAMTVKRIITEVKIKYIEIIDKLLLAHQLLKSPLNDSIVKDYIQMTLDYRVNGAIVNDAMVRLDGYQTVYNVPLSTLPLRLRLQEIIKKFKARNPKNITVFANNIPINSTNAVWEKKTYNQRSLMKVYEL